MKLLPAALVLLVPAAAHADRRGFAHTYEYQTQAEAETEVEVYTEQARTQLGAASDRRFLFQLAIEHGITAKWDVSLFQAFEEVAGVTDATDEAFGLDEVRVRSRYRFGERGKWPVNLLAYVEAVRAFETPVWEGEVGAVVTRHFDKLTAAVNLIGAVELDRDPGPDEEDLTIRAGWAAGLAYDLFSEIRVGAECWGELDIDDTSAIAASAGPVVSWTPATNLWVTAGAGFAITEYADDLHVRGIIGLQL